MNQWSVVYQKAIRDDGSLFFPERLSKEFLESARRTMGSYFFANQYQNEIVPEGERVFKPQWIRYYDANKLPERLHNFAFIDPAISQSENADYTALVVISVDVEKNWYVRHARRDRITPSEIINMCFDVHARWKPLVIGIENVAFQQSIVHFAHEEMKRRDKLIPITGINPGTDKTKELRILGLVPRFEWGTLTLAMNLHDMELELAEFPRGAHDDILDATANLENIVYYPQPLRKKNEAPNPNDPGYESWYINQLIKRQSEVREPYED